MTSVITTAGMHGLRTGDVVTVSVPDTRRWKRVLHRLLFLPPPVRQRQFKVGAIEGPHRWWLTTDMSGRELAALLEPWPEENRGKPAPVGLDPSDAQFGELHE